MAESMRERQLAARVCGLKAELEHLRKVRDTNAKDLAAAIDYVPRDDLLPEDPILPQVIDYALVEIPKLKARLKEALVKLGEPVEDVEA